MSISNNINTPVKADEMMNLVVLINLYSYIEGVELYLASIGVHTKHFKVYSLNNCL